jgi:hypothetical protein
MWDPTGRISDIGGFYEKPGEKFQSNFKKIGNKTCAL